MAEKKLFSLVATVGTENREAVRPVARREPFKLCPISDSNTQRISPIDRIT